MRNKNLTISKKYQQEISRNFFLSFFFFYPMDLFGIFENNFSFEGTYHFLNKNELLNLYCINVYLMLFHSFRETQIFIFDLNINCFLSFSSASLRQTSFKNVCKNCCSHCYDSNKNINMNFNLV